MKGKIRKTRMKVLAFVLSASMMMSSFAPVYASVNQEGQISDKTLAVTGENVPEPTTTDTPVITETAVTTQETAVTPEVTVEAETTVTPEVTVTPEATTTPETTVTPEVTTALEETVTPTPAEEAAAAPVSGDAGVKVVYKADGAVFPMFQITGSTAAVTAGGITISLSCNKATYDKIQIDGAGLAEGVRNTNETYNFTFTLSASASGQGLAFLPYKKSNGEPYTSKALKILIPDLVTMPTEAPEPTVTPTAVPTETPVLTETPTPIPETPLVTPAEDRISVIKEDGTEFKMFASVQTKTSAVIKDGKIQVNLIISNENYDKIYLGSKDDADKTPVIAGTKLSTGGYCFTFELPESDKGSCRLVSLGKPDDTWFSKYELYLNIPSDIPKEKPQATPTASPTPKPTAVPTAVPTQAPDAPKTENGVYEAEVFTGAAMFKVVGCELMVVNRKMSAHITLSGTGYDYLYMGKSGQAATDCANWIKYDGVVTNSDGKEQRTYTIPVVALDQPIAVASHSEKNVKWFDRTITINSSSMIFVRDLTDEEQKENSTENHTVVTPSPTETPTTDDSDPDDSTGSSSNGATSAVNTSTGLKDGVYTPDSFSWSGGSGRLKGITCTRITVKNGQAWATIVFASNGYSVVSANGSQYPAISNTSGTSTFEIPVQLNANNKISGLTTKMSTSHWIDYVLYIGLEAAKTADAVANKSAKQESAGIVAGNLGETEKDADAPKLTGLTYKVSLKLEHAKYFKLHYYENDIAVLEIDASTGEEDTQSSVFEKEKILYVLAAEDTELPAGVEKEACVIRIPSQKAYVDSQEVLEILDKLNVTDRITAVSCEEEQCTVDSVKTAMKENNNNAENAQGIIRAGSYKDLDFKELIKRKCDLAVISGDILPHEGDEEDMTVAEQYEAMKNLGDQLQVLGIPMLVDRSADEKDELARCEWYKVYGALFGCAAEAGKLCSEADE